MRSTGNWPVPAKTITEPKERRSYVEAVKRYLHAMAEDERAELRSQRFLVAAARKARRARLQNNGGPSRMDQGR